MKCRKRRPKLSSRQMHFQACEAFGINYFEKYMRAFFGRKSWWPIRRPKSE